MSNEKNQAVQAVLDRVTSYQDGAPDGTVEKELRSAFAETDVELTDEEFAKLATAVENADGPVSADDVLGG